MRAVTSVLLSLALLGAASEARAWGDDGHMIIGEIAWRELGPGTREAVADLLRDDDRTLAYASTWADRLRSDPTWDGVKPHHYVNAPDGATSFDLERDCPPPRGCVLRAIQEHAAALSEPATPRLQRLQAVKFLAHFVGDLHQPLHAAYGSDRGGNQVDVTFFGEATNLHRLWDTLLLQRRLGWPRSWSRRSLARSLAGSIAPGERSRWARGTPLEWARESFALARSHVYTAGPGEELCPGDDLGEAYYRRNLPVVEEQLRKAGARLAWLLSRALAGD